MIMLLQDRVIAGCPQSFLQLSRCWTLLRGRAQKARSDKLKSVGQSGLWDVNSIAGGSGGATPLPESLLLPSHQVGAPQGSPRARHFLFCFNWFDFNPPLPKGTSMLRVAFLALRLLL